MTSTLDAVRHFATHTPNRSAVRSAMQQWSYGELLDRAITLLQEGIAAYPHAAVLHNNLAVALERIDQGSGRVILTIRGVGEEAVDALVGKRR